VSASKRSSKKPEAARPRRGGPPPPPPPPPTGPPASARLTIKRTPGGRATIELPPRPQPSGVRRLSDVELEEDEFLIEGFDAQLNGVLVRVTAVLERTCVYLSREGERRLVSKKDLWIEADKLPIRRRGIG
jgi:hypothetical protein